MKESTFLTSQLTNDLKLIKNAHPEYFQAKPRTVYEEDPGMSFAFRVEELLAKSIPQRNPDYDQQLFNKELNNNRLPKKNLPIDNVRDIIATTIRDSKYTMIVGGTGSGKSTRVPQIIRQNDILQMKGSTCNIICTQPRRVAATSIAKRVAYELGEEIGKSVGYAIRGDVVVASCKEGGTIKYCTSGVLVRKLIDNPALIGVSHVVVDEIHERSLELEMLLRFLKELAELRRDFKLIVMSATMNTDTYQRYLDHCEIVQIPGSMFPVETFYLEDMRSIVGSSVSSVEMRSDSRYFVILKLVEYIVVNKEEGAILIFVPGWRDMDELQNRFSDYNSRQTHPQRMLKVRLLHSKVPLEDRKIFDPVKGPGRKVLISTTIAESSITVPDVVFVIDLGLTNVSSYHDQHKSSAVSVENITKASAEQRRGRAGRVKPGVCYRLYTR